MARSFAVSWCRATMEMCTANFRKKKTFYYNDSKITDFVMIDAKNSSIVYIEWIDYAIGFGLEQDDGSLITVTVALANPLHSIRSRSTAKHWNLWVRRSFSSW